MTRDSSPTPNPATTPQVGLASLLVRHYTWSGLAEARKVLGGAGPGLLQIPGSVLWAGISLVDLATEIAVRKRSPLQLPPALGHVGFTLTSQLVGVSARFLQVCVCVCVLCVCVCVCVHVFSSVRSSSEAAACFFLPQLCAARLLLVKDHVMPA